MGMCCWTMCRECGVEAPQVGDFGYLGYPSLDEAVSGSDAVTFGAIYRALEGIHAVTEEVDELRRFLVSHQGHNVVTENEEGLVFGEEDERGGEGSGGERSAADDLDVTESTEPEDEDEALEADLLDDDDPAGVYLRARYRAVCARCSESVVTGDLYAFSPFERTRLSPDAMGAFQRTVVPALERDCYNAEPLYVGDVARLDTFFEAHRDHEVFAELTPTLME